MNVAGLNPAQQLAVTHTEGPLMILAGAGSGKTRTLISRIQYLIEEKRLSPYQVLAVTFSNKAAREMRERLALVSSFDIGTFQVTTFHSFCARLLRMEASFIGLSRNFTIYDDGESTAVTKAVLAQRGISQKDISPGTLSYYIDAVKNRGHYRGQAMTTDIQGLSDDPRMYDLFLDYETELHRNNAVDFGGLITGAVNLFTNFPEVLKRYQEKFKYVLVDEYQDTNRAQFELIRLLSFLHKNICVVGDEDQSIYSWRGADIRNILDFEEIFPGAKLIKLEQNYRSSKKIIEAAGQVIACNQARKGKTMWTDNAEGEAIQIMECRDEKSEGDFIAQEIKKLSQTEGAEASDIAIIYRSNAQSRSLEDSLRRERIAYRVVAGIKFYDRKEVKDMLGYVRVVVNKKDSLAVTRIINVPARGVGTTSIKKLEEEAVRQNLALFELLELIVARPSDYKQMGLSGKVHASINNLVNLVHEAQVLDEQKTIPSFTYEKLLHESGYLEYLKADRSYEGQARLENLEELSNGIKQFELSTTEPTLAQFLETITLDQTEAEETGEMVSLMTAHGSKGLEYPYVFVTGAEENLFPSFKSMELGGNAIEEERRLFYVAMTRAMKRLYITFAQGRMLWGSLKFNGPSPFVNEIPANYYNWDFFQAKKRSFESAPSFDEYSQETSYGGYDDKPKNYYQKPAAVKSLSQFPSGIKVVHALYGEGTVVESEGLGADEKVSITFRDGTKKKFMVKFAPIQKIS